MQNKPFLMVVSLLCFQITYPTTDVRIRNFKGDVKVRRGLEEAWNLVGTGMLLEDIDSILTGEVSEVVLVIDGERLFTLGGNSILDISDLRKITDRELFLYLMSQKLKNIERPTGESKLRIENIGVVRAERKGVQTEAEDKAAASDVWRYEVNGARALYEQSYYPNAIVKLHKILERYATVDDGGEIHLYLGRSFEAIDESGRAIDAYRQVLERAKTSSVDSSRINRYVAAASEAIERLKE